MPGNELHPVDAYLASVPEPARSTLNKMRAMLRAAVPPESIEVISYGMPAFKYKKPLVAYAAFKQHCSFFPMSGSVVEALQDDLKAYRTFKGTIQFPLDKPLPAALVKKLVKARLEQSEEKETRQAERKRARQSERKEMQRSEETRQREAAAQKKRAVGALRKQASSARPRKAPKP